MGIFDGKYDKSPTPSWMKWAILAFIVFAGLNAYRAELSDDADAPKLQHYPKVKQFVSLQHWQSHLDPDYGRELELLDIQVGEGDIAACGQQVKLSVRYLGNEALPETFTLPETALTFHFGDGTAHPVFDRGARGMRRGGVRQLRAGAVMLGGTISDSAYPFELSLEELTPYLADENHYEAEFIDTGGGTPALCGDTIKARIGEDETILTLGQNAHGHGIDRALIGMRPGAKKRVIIPPAYAEGGQKSIVEIERLPYNEAEVNTESPDESDRPTPERH